MLNADVPVPAILPEAPTWGRIFHRLLAQASPNITIESIDFDVTVGEYPASLTDYDGIVLSGSAKAAYDDVPWVKSLDAYIADVYANSPRVKIFGTCFGHQLICQSLLKGYGVTAELDPRGLEIGVKEITLNEQFREAFGKRVRGEMVLLNGDLSGKMRLQFVHGDHVVVPSLESLPTGWTMVGGTEHCAVQGLYEPCRVFTL